MCKVQQDSLHKASNLEVSKFKKKKKKELVLTGKLLLFCYNANQNKQIRERTKEKNYTLEKKLSDASILRRLRRLLRYETWMKKSIFEETQFDQKIYQLVLFF